MKLSSARSRFLSARKSAPRVARSLACLAPLAFTSLALLWCQVGYLTPGVSRMLGSVLWLITVYLAAREARWLWLLLSAILLFNPLGAAHGPQGLWLLGLLPWAGGLWGKRWMGAAWMAALAGWIWTHFPEFWVPLDEFVAKTAHWLSGANLSAAAAGIPLLLLAVSFPLAAACSQRRRYAPLMCSAALILALLLYWWLLPPLDFNLHRWGIHGVHDAFNMQWALLILLAAVLAIWGYLDPPEVRDSARHGILLIPILSLAGALLIGWPPAVSRPALQREIVFYNKGYLNWQVPVYGNYGRHSAGMFGLLPDYLRWRGFNVVLKDSLAPAALESAGVVVIVNLTDPLSSPEESALHQFVNAGGSLLLLGDHTGMASIRAPSNQLLQPYGIELNFDSAKPTRTGWAGSLLCAAHPLTARLALPRMGGKSPAQTQIWVGASLQVSPPARPLILGRAGWSDAGDENNEQNGYLGDFHYQKNERLGNLVLLAEAHPGKGKVLVFGDTSTMQNGALVRAGGFVVRIFNYLLSPVNYRPTLLRILGAALFILAAFFWAFSGARQGGLALGVIAFFLGAGLAQHRTAVVADAPQRPWTAQAHPRALLDHSHAPRTPLNQTSGSGHWGLQNCFMRSRFLPQVMEDWNNQTLQDARVLVEIAPAKRFHRQQKDDIARFMENGGLLILCCGTEEFDGSKSLLPDYGLEPVYVPLGPAQLPAEVTLPPNSAADSADFDTTLTVQFHEAWAVNVSNPRARVLLRGYEKPVVVFVPVGKGGLLYIPDTDFLTNRNLESPTDEYYEANILYLRYLLRELAGGS